MGWDHQRNPVHAAAWPAVANTNCGCMLCLSRTVVLLASSCLLWCCSLSSSCCCRMWQCSSAVFTGCRVLLSSLTAMLLLQPPLFVLGIMLSGCGVCVPPCGSWHLSALQGRHLAQWVAVFLVWVYGTCVCTGRAVWISHDLCCMPQVLVSSSLVQQLQCNSCACAPDVPPCCIGRHTSITWCTACM
jgi:hypothetical protein